MNKLVCRKRLSIASFCVMLAVFAAFMAGALLPSGFMPAVRDGVTQIVICSGTGTKTVAVNNDGVPSGQDNEKQHQKFCAYQVLASGKLDIPPPPFILSVPYIEDVSYGLQNHLISNGATVVSWTARGPPSA